MQLWLCPLIAFLLGSIPFGLIIAKAKGINIREHGSGNIGATNVLRVIGKKYGISCLLLDALKGFSPTVIAISLIQFEGMKNPMSITALAPYAREFPMLTAQIFQVVAGLCAILGHNYSPWVGFKGGKGIATSAGVLIAMMPAAIVILIVVWGVIFLTTRYVSLASIVAAAALPLLTLWGSWFDGKVQNGTWNKPLFVFSLIIAVLAIWKHRSNIARLRDGTEHRFTRKPKPDHV
ncbi:MAG: glycerol-3-phosphate 1-O-acyltransferase PlsY [Akkermansiaceae bacterium]